MCDACGVISAGAGSRATVAVRYLCRPRIRNGPGYALFIVVELVTVMAWIVDGSPAGAGPASRDGGQPNPGGSMRRFTGLALVGLGAFLLVAALLTRTYV